MAIEAILRFTCNGCGTSTNVRDFEFPRDWSAMTASDARVAVHFCAACTEKAETERREIFHKADKDYSEGVPRHSSQAANIKVRREPDEMRRVRTVIE